MNQPSPPPTSAEPPHSPPVSFFSAAFSNAYLLMALTALFWAGNTVLGRGVAGHIPPISLACLRWTLAGLLLLMFAWPHLRRDWREIVRHWGIIILLGVTGPGLFNTLQYVGLNHTSAINGSVLQSAAPVVVAIVGFALFGDRLSARQGLGMAISITGVLVLIARGDVERLLGLQVNVGDLWFLAGFVSWGLYTAYLRKRPGIHWLSFVAITSLIAGAMNFPGAVVENLTGSVTLQWSWTTALSVAYASVFPSAFAYAFYNRSVELIGGNRTAVFLHLVPLYGTVLAIVVLGEPLLASQLIGFALIITGVVLATRVRT